MMLGAWGVMLVGVAWALVGRVIELASAGVTMAFFAGAWRHLIAGGMMLWLCAVGASGQEWMVPERWRAGGRRGIRVAAVFLAVGMVVVAGVLLVAAMRHGEEQLGALRWLIVGTGAEVVGLLVAGAVMMRVGRVVK